MVQTVYKTEDGEIWDSLEEAEKHQKQIKLWEEIIDRYGTYGELRISYFSEFIDVINFYEENK